MEVSIKAGSHVPCIPSSEVSGSAGGLLFTHSGPIWTNAGVIGSVTMMSIAVTCAHCPVSGVNVYVVVSATEVSMNPCSRDALQRCIRQYRRSVILAQRPDRLELRLDLFCHHNRYGHDLGTLCGIRGKGIDRGIRY